MRHVACIHGMHQDKWEILDWMPASVGWFNNIGLSPRRAEILKHYMGVE